MRVMSLMLLSLAFSACDKNDDQKTTLHGKWVLHQTVTTDLYYTEEMNNDWKQVSKDEAFILELTSDGAIISYEADPPCTGTYEQRANGSLTTDFDCRPIGYDNAMPAVFSFDGHYLVLAYGIGDESSYWRRFKKVD
ncbi:hypothetical protein [Olivibacter sitiensis]|uniref:hypothetical protein n=1 Tax=Olivibacter sitiensis TaxID=376470 RepID=UPI0012FAB7D4|nr:hypothetical protein [Olivibacter sitiensis]